MSAGKKMQRRKAKQFAVAVFSNTSDGKRPKLIYPA